MAVAAALKQAWTWLNRRWVLRGAKDCPVCGARHGDSAARCYRCSYGFAPGEGLDGAHAIALYRRMRRAFIAAALCTLLPMLTCAVVGGMQFARHYASDYELMKQPRLLQVGMTEFDVIDRVGAPAAVESRSAGAEVWTYRGWPNGDLTFEGGRLTRNGLKDR